MKMLVSGGHITPAIALIQYTRSIDPTIEVVFAGRQYSQTKTKQLSWEQIEVEKQQVTFVTFEAARLNLNSVADCFRLLYRFPLSLISAIQLVIRHRPHIFISFGSYQAVPLAIAAWLLQIPVITHEQTRTIGFANKIISVFAKKVAISFKETAQELPKSKAVFTGNLLRKNLLNTKATRPTWLLTQTKKPLLYITGGNQGSEVINTAVAQILSRLTKKWFVIHQCGNATAKRNYRKELESQQHKLPSAQKFSYIVKEWIAEEDLAWIYENAHVIISRAGANTLQEILFFQVPSILIPLPFSRNNEQQLGAEYLSKKGGSYILHQKDLQPNSLIDALEVVQEQHADMKKQLKQLPLVLDADKKLFDLIATTAQQ